ncbi:hypothetical protein Barb6_01953 [Bacteroidales bacterium Barb6]|nr:hypothetical protein Barb6_01953 [Bacteroidales bacterium Barb6]
MNYSKMVSKLQVLLPELVQKQPEIALHIENNQNGITVWGFRNKKNSSVLIGRIDLYNDEGLFCRLSSGNERSFGSFIESIETLIDYRNNFSLRFLEALWKERAKK